MCPCPFFFSIWKLNDFYSYSSFVSVCCHFSVSLFFNYWIDSEQQKDFLLKELQSEKKRVEDFLSQLEALNTSYYRTKQELEERKRSFAEAESQHKEVASRFERALDDARSDLSSAQQSIVHRDEQVHIFFPFILFRILQGCCVCLKGSNLFRILSSCLGGCTTA